MKKMTAILMVTMLILSLFCSCSAGNGDEPSGNSQQEEKAEPPGNNQTIANSEPLVVYIPEFSATGGDVKQTVAMAAEIFTEKYGIEVEYYPSPDDFSGMMTLDERALYRDKLYAEMMAGKGPDVFVFAFGDSGVFTDKYKQMDAGAFYDLNAFIEKDDDFDMGEFEGTIMDAGVHKGHRYFIPLSYGVNTLVASKEKLAELGLSADDFSSFERFLSTWEELQQRGGVHLMQAQNEWVMFSADGGWLHEYVDFETGTTSFDAPSFKRMTDLFIAEYQAEETGMSSFDVEKLFAYQTFVTDYPLNPGVTRLDAEDIALIPLPTEEGDCLATIIEHCMISSTAKSPDAAWNFIKTMLSDEAQEKAVSRRFGVTVKSKYIDAAIDAQLSYMGKANPFDDALTDTLKNMYHNYDGVFLPENDGGLWRRVRTYYTTEDRQSFDEFKAEIENYYKIWLSE